MSRYVAAEVALGWTGVVGFMGWVFGGIEWGIVLGCLTFALVWRYPNERRAVDEDDRKRGDSDGEGGEG